MFCAISNVLYMIANLVTIRSCTNLKTYIQSARLRWFRRSNEFLPESIVPNTLFSIEKKTSAGVVQHTVVCGVHFVLYLSETVRILSARARQTVTIIIFDLKNDFQKCILQNAVQQPFIIVSKKPKFLL